MAITHPDAARTSLAAVILGIIDGGAGNGKCVMKAGANVAASVDLNKPSFTAGTPGVLNLDTTGGLEDDNATGDVNPIDSVEFQDSTNVVAFTGDNITTGGGGGDLDLSKAIIAPGDVVQLTAYTYTACP